MTSVAAPADRVRLASQRQRVLALVASPPDALPAAVPRRAPAHRRPARLAHRPRRPRRDTPGWPTASAGARRHRRPQRRPARPDLRRLVDRRPSQQAARQSPRGRPAARARSCPAAASPKSTPCSIHADFPSSSGARCPRSPTAVNAIGEPAIALEREPERLYPQTRRSPRTSSAIPTSTGTAAIGMERVARRAADSDPATARPARRSSRSTAASSRRWRASSAPRWINSARSAPPAS